MIYRSNLTAPDLQPHFKHVTSRVLGHSFGHDVLSDWSDKPDDDPVFGLYKTCGFWTHDEAAILYNIAKGNPGRWLDIGAHTGWTTAHLAAAGCKVTALEPMLRLDEWQRRLEQNLYDRKLWDGVEWMPHLRSDEFFATYEPFSLQQFRGVVIDGDHNAPYPVNDARCSANRLEDDGVILFHDAMGGPVWQGIYELLDRGFRCHVYFTPHIVAACARNFAAFRIHHIPDPAINWQEIKTNHMKDFDWNRVTHDAIA